ncbi:MAG: hypothetical protein K0Q79_1019 [Flavipsychrobacter sp.]|jgi:predicted transposase YbfD/YdcC|nr:hypothetical protein [Flavipsychrobacter sp.]
MSTYRVRTHDGTLAWLIWFGLLVGGAFALREYNVEYITGPDRKHRLVALIVLSYVVVYFITSKVQEISITDDGVTAKWYKGNFGFRLYLKTIKWQNIKWCRWSKGVRVKTKDGELYTLFCLGSIWQKNYKEFNKDFEEHFDIAHENSLVGKKAHERNYSPNEPWR